MTNEHLLTKYSDSLLIHCHRTKFWGFIYALIYFEPFVSGPDSTLTALAHLGYATRLTQDRGSGPSAVLAGPVQPFPHPVSSTLVANLTSFIPVGVTHVRLPCM